MSRSRSRGAGALFRPLDANAVAAAFAPDQNGGAVGVHDLPGRRVRLGAFPRLLRAGRCLARRCSMPETMLHARTRGEQLMRVTAAQNQMSSLALTQSGLSRKKRLVVDSNGPGRIITSSGKTASVDVSALLSAAVTGAPNAVDAARRKRTRKRDAVMDARFGMAVSNHSARSIRIRIRQPSLPTRMVVPFSSMTVWTGGSLVAVASAP